MMAAENLKVATGGPEYLFDDIQFIWSVVKQGVEGVALCQEEL